MSNPIKYNDLVSQDVEKRLKALAEGFKVLDDELKKVGTTAKTLLDTTKNTDFQGLKKLESTFKEVNKAQKESVIISKERQKLDQEIERTTQQKIKTEQQALRLKTQQARETERLVKQQVKEKKAADALNSAYAKESKRLNELRKRFKDLILVEGESSKAAKKLGKEIGVLDTKLKKVDAATGQFQRNVGNYPKGFKGAIGALKNFAGALGITAGIAGLTRALGNSIKIAKEFEQSNANLASVLGTTKESITALTDDAKRLGAATAFSASEVSALQTEFAKLGFNEQEILNATEATLSLAAATGSDLSEAAAVAGATLGGFGLGAEETQRVVDVMAKSFSTSALDLEKFKEAMKGAAPAAAAVGISVEETTALLGTLANAGISGSKAGNNLKTSFINLNAAGLTLEQGLEKVANSEDKLGTAAKLVGKNAAASFLVLSEGVDVTAELTKGLNNAGGAAEKMAKEQLNTLSGSLKILNSAWEGFVLGLLSGDGAFSKISRSIVETTTALLGMLTPSNELAESWFRQRDEVQQLEKDMNPLLDRYDELKTKTELTVDEQTELDTIINKIAEDLPGAITEFDKYGKALDISTTAARKLIKQQKDLLALDNAEAIIEQEEAIEGLNNKLATLNREYFISEGVLVRYDKQLKQNLKADAEEIRNFAERGEKIRSEIELRDAKIAKLRGEKSAAELAAEAEDKLNKSTGKNIDNTKELIGLIEKQSKVVSDLQTKIRETTDEDQIVRLKLVLVGEKEELKRLKDLGENSLFNVRALQKQAEKDRLAREKADREATDKALETDLVVDQKRIDAAQKLADDEERLRLEAVESAKRERDERRKFIKETTTEILNAFKERSEAREKEIDSEITAVQKRQDQLRTLSQSGVQNAQESLADANVREAQLRKQKEDQIKRQEQIAAGLAAVNVFAAEIESGKTPTEAFGTTITSISLLRQIISSIPAFESGIDNTSSLNGVGGNGVDGRGGFHAILHPNEAVFNATDTAKKGGLTNSEAGNVLEAYNKGYLNNWNMGIAPQSTDNSIALAAGLSEMNGHIKDMKKSIGESKKYELDSFMNWAKVTTKEGNTRTTDFNDTKGLF